MSLTKEDIKALIEEKTETPNKDFKEGFVWGKQNKDLRLEIIKDIMAMANINDGGKLVIGVKDKTYEHIGLSDKEYDSFDSTPINELLHKYADPVFNCSVYKRRIDGKKTVVIDVPEFTEVPIVCKKFTNSTKNKQLLRKGAVYIRTQKCTSEEISSADEMRKILGAGITKKSEEIFEVIQKIVKGVPINTRRSAKKDQYSKEIKDSLEFIKNNLKNNENFGRWELVIHPNEYRNDLIKNQLEAGKLIENSKVRLRGWDFPYIDSHGNFTNFNKGKQSVTISDRVPHREVWRIYKSGLFIWSEILGEDLMGFTEHDQKVLYFVSRLYSITEFCLFMKRLYTESLQVDLLNFKLTIFGSKNRRLGSGQPGLLRRDYICVEEPILIEKIIPTIELTASFKEVAKDIIRELFLMFNWDDPSDKMLEDWQVKLIEKGG